MACVRWGGETRGVKLGYISMNTEYGTRPDDLARELEARGYDSFWVGEHSHIPVDRTTPYPGGGELPQEYWHMMDPFVSLMAAGAATSDLKLGTGVCLVLEHDVLALAKSVATLDVLSGGRVLFGVGTGWNVEELANHRPDFEFKKRYSGMRETVQALRTLWTEEEAGFDGDIHHFTKVWSYPKPVQDPLPVLLGNAGPLGIQHMIDYGDGWAPVDAGLRHPETGRPDTLGQIEAFREKAATAGRDPESIEISLFAWGDPPPERLESYAAAGVTRAVLGASRKGMGDPATTEPFLDRYAELIPDLV